MAHKRKPEEKTGKAPYTIDDALKIADDVFKLSQEKKYNLGAFVHGLTFALEYIQYNYKIPQQQVAGIRRGCRKYFKQIENIKKPPA
jgi:hypothetical protein